LNTDMRNSNFALFGFFNGRGYIDQQIADSSRFCTMNLIIGPDITTVYILVECIRVFFENTV
jgi:hypothetical protein